MHKDQAATPVSSVDWPTILYGWSLRYLGRYASSKAQLERFLKNKMAKRPDLDPKGAYAAFPALISKLENLGYLDDVAYARGMSVSLIRSGKSDARIRQKLKDKGLDTEMVSSALEEARERLGLDTARDQALTGALICLRKRGQGPYLRPDREAKEPDKVMGMLARAGYSYDIAKTAINLSRDEAEQILDNIA